MDTEELVFRFECFDDWQERYRYLIDLGQASANGSLRQDRGEPRSWVRESGMGCG